MKVGKIYTFEAAHHLPNHYGKCRNPHGHSYRLEVEVEGTVQHLPGKSSDGMVFDFAVLDSHMEPIIALLDHNDLNIIFTDYPPTAEIILGWIYNKMIATKPATLNWSRLRLWETAKGYAEWP